MVAVLDSLVGRDTKLPPLPLHTLVAAAAMASLDLHRCCPRQLQNDSESCTAGTDC